ncbi:ATP-binding protein [Streptomyces sp. NPDC006632]|uniref:ATP-binding protein n=1 Tax=unclassified Streptomyces TaxID=2593676 RepID=UPI002E1AB070
MARPPATTGTGSPPDLDPSVTGPTTAAQARDTARDFLAALVPAPSKESIENAVLIVSELVTNALRHAGGATSLDLAADPATLRISVRDPSPVPPRERTPDLRGYEGGFGWLLVRYLAKSVAVTPAADGGKNVCVALPR